MNTPSTSQKSFTAVLRSVGSDKQVGIVVALTLALAVVSGALDLINPLTIYKELLAVVAMTTLIALVVIRTIFVAFKASGRELTVSRASRALIITGTTVALFTVLFAIVPELLLVTSLYVAAGVSIPWVTCFIVATFASKRESKIMVIKGMNTCAVIHPREYYEQARKVAA